MDNIGGAEMVTLYLARELDADIYTTNIDELQIKKMGFAEIVPRIKSIGRIPKMAPFRHQLALWKFRQLKLGNKYDLYIVSGDWAMSGLVNNKPNIWYVHSPLNELWAFKTYVRNEVLSWWKRPLFDVWVWFNRLLTIKYSRHAEMILCNSNNTMGRLKKFYKRSAAVVNPPVDTSKHAWQTAGDFWLSVNRITKHKRIEIQMKAFSKLPNEKLIIVGSYERGAQQFEDYKKYIESIRPANVTILSWVDSKELLSLYDTCKGFITTAKDEDFGMTPIEAMASGKPVIAPNEGGYKETIIDKQTGILIDNIDELKLVEAINLIGSELKLDPHKYTAACISQSQKFNLDSFIQKIKSYIK